MREDEDIKSMPTAALLDRALALAATSDEETDDDNPYWRCVRELHRRGTEDDLKLALALAAREPEAQVVASDVLGQLGFDTRQTTGWWPHRTASLPPLLALLKSPEWRVRSSAVSALGHLGLDGIESDVLALATDASEEVRFSLAVALCTRDDDASIATLAALSNDADDDVRNWATFAMGSQCERDDDTVRNALAARVEDPHKETRGEAFLGLATRGDPRGMAPLVRVLESDYVWSLDLEAAEAYANPALLPHLYRLRASVGADDDPSWVSQLHEAIAACERGATS